MQFPLGEKDTEGSFRREIRTGGNLPLDVHSADNLAWTPCGCALMLPLSQHYILVLYVRVKLLSLYTMVWLALGTAAILGENLNPTWTPLPIQNWTRRLRCQQAYLRVCSDSLRSSGGLSLKLRSITCFNREKAGDGDVLIMHRRCSGIVRCEEAARVRQHKSVVRNPHMWRRTSRNCSDLQFD